MKRVCLALAVLVGFASAVHAQARLVPPKGASLPASCNIGDLFTKTSATAGLYVCSAANTWTIVTSGSATAAPIDATYITKTANSTLTAEQALGSLATGILKSTTTTGTVSIAAAGTDYQAPITCADTGVVFASAANTLTCDIAKLFFDDSANELHVTSSADDYAAVVSSSGTASVATRTSTSAANVSSYAGLGTLALDGYKNSAFVRTELFSGVGRGTFAAPLTLQDNDKLFDIYVENDGGMDYDNIAKVSIEVDGVPADADTVPTRIVFSTTNTAGTLGESFRINALGNIAAANGKAVTTDTTAAHTMLWQAYDTDTGPGYVTFATFTNGNSPSLAFSAPAGGATLTMAPTTLTIPSGTSLTGGTVTARLVANGSAPAVANVAANSCGTSAATIAGNDNTGEITVGATAGTQCRITFTVAASVRYNCTCSDSTTAALCRSTFVDTTHSDIFGAFTAGDVVEYICLPR